MVVESRHLSGTLRLLDSTDATIHSYHRISPQIGATSINAFIQGVEVIRGEPVNNALVTITTELVDTDA
jgi:hypothetical protein